MEAASTIQIIATALSVLGGIIPAIWWLSTRIERNNGSLDTKIAQISTEIEARLGSMTGVIETHSAKIEEKMSNLERQIGEITTQVVEARKESNGIRERVVALETRMEIIQRD
jgi:septal ring factor EnvC (AmiA/AmiB activator)